MTRRSVAALALVAGALAACRETKPTELEGVVRHYLERVAEAYRVSDASLMDPLVSERQGLKLTGLIGVKRDAGVVLDAKLLELRFRRVARDGEAWVVETAERWSYADRKIGTGEQVGEASTDAYAMRYRFVRQGGRWVLDALEFAEPPQVGRSAPPMTLDARRAHGLPPADEPGGGAPAAAQPAPPATGEASR